MIKKFITVVSAYAEDICILSGLTFIAAATFLISFIAGLYVTGVLLLGLGIWFTTHGKG